MKQIVKKIFPYLHYTEILRLIEWKLVQNKLISVH